MSITYKDLDSVTRKLNHDEAVMAILNDYHFTNERSLRDPFVIAVVNLIRASERKQPKVDPKAPPIKRVFKFIDTKETRPFLQWAYCKDGWLSGSNGHCALSIKVDKLADGFYDKMGLRSDDSDMRYPSFDRALLVPLIASNIELELVNPKTYKVVGHEAHFARNYVDQARAVGVETFDLHKGHLISKTDSMLYIQGFMYV